nr:PEP/pyruvate-binding domain-containing protein [Ardenticatenaceae bacterium]
MTNHTFLLALDDSEATLEKVGGKGQATAQMAALNLSLPPGFYLTTAAYRHFVKTNQLHGKISDLLKQGEGTGAEIRALFAAGEMPAEIVALVQDAYAALGSGKPAVAVRSSATAEDLPGMSFAGQQDTYLNVQGSDHLIPAV